MNQEDNDALPGLPPDSDIGDRNVERLLGESYRPETVDPEFAKRVEAAMCSVARDATEARAKSTVQVPFTRRRRMRWFTMAWPAIAATMLIAVGFVVGRNLGRHAADDLVDRPVALKDLPETPKQQMNYWRRSETGITAGAVASNEPASPIGSVVGERLTPRPRPPIASVDAVQWGETLDTGAGERRRVNLADSSVLYLNQNTHLTLDTERQITLGSGEIYVEVSPLEAGTDHSAAMPTTQAGVSAAAQRPNTFMVRTPGREIAALGTKFAVRSDDSGANVLVTQGKVRISGMGQPITAGQQVVAENAPVYKSVSAVSPLPRASAVLDWTRDLVVAAESPLVPVSPHSGGSIVARDPNGQEARLSLRKYHIDVHIEDGFARTTIDQTYFNHTSWRLEGTFHFPLPPDASLSRLAMYVDGKLMEGGMAERNYARDVFERIVRTQKDPALLEWVDGSTFKMRVFPLEARQEKRIVLSYTQRLDTLYGNWKYRFPAGHSLDAVRDWSFHARVERGAELTWSCDSHEMKQSKDGSDLLLDAEAKQAKLDRDVVLRFTDRSFDAGVARFSSALHDDQRTMMLRYRPELPSKSQRQRRDWVFLFESSGDREPVLARVQVDVIKTLLNNAEHDDTFAILTAGTQVRAFANELMPATPENVKKAVEFLDGVHLVGALDLGQGLAATEPFVKSGKDAYIVHVGSGMPVLGERAEDKLLQRIPNGARYIGVGVGKRWSRQFMKTAASRTGGYFTQINPDEPVAWRAFDLYSTLNTPRLLGISVADQAERATFLCYDDSIAHGEELCAIARLAAADPFPQKIIVSGTLDGEPFRREIAVDRIADKADYIPRTWAKLRIDQLLAEDPARHKDEIISLSKAMYVMSPFTSLLVLENEQMYVQFNVDRGRKDHWAMYDCPPEIPVVYEPERSKPDETRKSVQVTNESGKPRSLPDIFLVRIPPQFITHPAGTSYYSLGQTYMSLVVSPDDESISANQARWGANRRLALRPSLQRYWFRHPSAEAEQNLPGLGVYFRALPNNGTWSSEIDVHGDFEFPDTLEKLITGRNEFSASFDGRYLWDTYGKDTGWNVPLHSWVVDVSPWMEREEIAEQWKNTDRFSLPVGKLLPSLGLPAFDGAGVDGYRLGRLFVDLGVPLQQGVEGRRFDPHFAFLPMDGQVPSNIGALDVKGLEDLGVVILRGIPQDVEGMKNIISEVQKISGGVNGGWLSYKARVEQQLQLQRELREQKESRSLESLRAVDESALPFDKSFMSIRYPDAKSWEDLADSVIRNKLRVYPGDLLDTSSLRRSEANLRKSRLFFESNGGRPMQDGVSLWVSMGEITGATPFVGSNWANPDAGFASFHMPDNFRRGLAAPYERPSFSGETRVFSDFVSFAPGMLTSQVDVLGLLEAEIASDVKRDRGNIDPAALALIERARETAWQTITFPSQTGREHRELTVDGAGRFLSEATTTVGLREQVICDGTTLWHLYPELGVGTRRSISRFHRAGLRSLVPWLLPPAEELARGANLRLAADRTVAIVPRWAEGAKDADGNPMQYVCLHLVFAEDGRLVERRLLKMPSSEVLARETYDADGTVRLIGADDKVLAEVKRPIEPATNEPNLVPDTNLVLLPIPARTRDHIIESTGRQHYGNFGEWSEEDALKLLAADLSQDPVQLMQIIGQRFFAKGDHRIGFYTLLMSSGLTWDPQSEQAMNNGTHVRFDPVVDHPDSMLAKYVFLHEQQMTKSGKIEEMDLATQHPSPPGGEGSLSHNAFVQQLAEFRDLYVRSIKATNLLSNDPSHEANRQKAIDFVQRAQSPLFGWAVLTLFKDRDATPEAHRAWAAASMRFERVLGLSYAARYEAARSYVRAGDWQKARELFSDLYTRTLKRGILPPIDEAFNQAFQNGGDNGLNHQERKVFRDAAMFLMDKKARSAIIAIAWQCHHVGDRQIADELFAMACAGLGDTERIETTLTGVAYLAQTEQYTRAEALLQPLLDDDQLSQIPVLWRLGAALAEKNGMTARSVACLDRAMDIEYEHLPEEVNLEAVRAEFGKLLTRYQQLADSIASLRLEPSQDIMNRVVRAADRWRSLDPDDTTACQAAARVLDRLGAREAAWEYVTTPFGDKPGEPPTWLSLGQEMREQACIELADRAYQNAFIAEPTNAQILWERAQMLEQTGKSDVARQCYRQIADGQWDSQFQSIQTQARKAINE